MVSTSSSGPQGSGNVGCPPRSRLTGGRREFVNDGMKAYKGNFVTSVDRCLPSDWDVYEG